MAYPSVYPTALDEYTTKTDNVDNVMAVDVNELQSAIAAIETKLGVGAGTITLQSTAPSLVLTDTTPSAKSLTVAIDANVANLRESAGAAGSLLVLDLANNRVGIGTAVPSWKLHITQATNTWGFLITDGTGEGGFGIAADNSIWFGTRSNHDLSIRANNAGKAIFTVAGNFKIGGAAVRGTTEGTSHIDVFNGTAPVGTLANGGSIYCESGELKVMDAAGNSTPISPHNEKGEWIFFSKNTVTGRVFYVAMERMMRAINEKFGWDFVREYSEVINGQ